MSTIKKENKEIYDGIKLNTESKERIIDELVEKIESNSSSNISELDRRRNEKMKRNEGIVKVFKVGAVACFSLLASGLIISSVMKYKNSNGNKVGKETSVEISSTDIKETANTNNQETVNEEIKETQETVNETKDEFDDFWKKVDYAMDFELVKEPDYKNDVYLGDYEYKYSECDVDGDGKNDAVNLKLSSDTNGGVKDNTVIVSINGKETKKLKYDEIKGYNPRNVKLIKLWNGSCFVYFDVGELTLLKYQTMFSLKDYKTVIDSSNLPYMSSLKDIVINEDTHGIYFYYWTQLNYVAGSIYQCYFEYYKNEFITDHTRDTYANVLEFRDKKTKKYDPDYREEYVLKEDKEFYLNEDKSGRKIILKKGEKLYYSYARYNLAKKNTAKDGNVLGNNAFYDMYCFEVKDEGDSGMISVFLDPVEEGKEYYKTEIFEDTAWVQ
ncbi:hypothetical protein [Eubacterium sp.]|uniref:hypothetical protein n=1 Tax=Eubacterium sp. TaxID=142586 RepID=UPI0025D2C813|nr:hypothetical protein [Eubacterium sp.]MCR5628699.1 hypothetical protein [Eubacterium sp.]